MLTGPIKEFAYRRGEDATADIMELLWQVYGVSPPHEILGTQKMRDEWHAAQQKLKEAVQELIWIDECCSF